mgnify:CR=1 FL=1
MDIHEYQAKKILSSFGIGIPRGGIAYSPENAEYKAREIGGSKWVVKAQIHSGARGKAGGIKITNNINELIDEAKKLFGKKLITHQTGPQGREVKRLYIEELSEISNEYYLSCLVDRSTSKIAFISSVEGGIDIEEVARNRPKKIITTKLSLSNGIQNEDVEKIIEPFCLSNKLKIQAVHLVKSIYKMLIETDANLIEINPLISTKKGNIICLDAKINFDDNALYRHPEIASLRDFNEQDPLEVEASKHGLTYIKLSGNIGCMVNGAGLAMATMDIIKLYGSEPANF